jgi:hypothetical protein
MGDNEEIQALALLSGRSGVFNLVNYWAFQDKTVSGFLYPVFRLLYRTRSQIALF